MSAITIARTVQSRMTPSHDGDLGEMTIIARVGATDGIEALSLRCTVKQNLVTRAEVELAIETLRGWLEPDEGGE